MTQIKNFFLNNEHYTTQDEINLYDLITYFDYNESLLVLLKLGYNLGSQPFSYLRFHIFLACLLFKTRPVLGSTSKLSFVNCAILPKWQSCVEIAASHIGEFCCSPTKIAFIKFLMWLTVKPSKPIVSEVLLALDSFCLTLH